MKSEATDVPNCLALQIFSKCLVLRKTVTHLAYKSSATAWKTRCFQQTTVTQIVSIPAARIVGRFLHTTGTLGALAAFPRSGLHQQLPS